MPITAATAVGTGGAEESLIFEEEATAVIGFLTCFFDEVDKRLRKRLVVCGIGEIVGAVCGMVGDKNTVTFEAAVVIVQELAFDGQKFGQGNTRKIVYGVHINPMGWFRKGVGMSSGFTSILCEIVKIYTFCTDELINARYFIQPGG
jgi:hypothetical protein